mgnify:CR=1 FL=1
MDTSAQFSGAVLGVRDAFQVRGSRVQEPLQRVVRPIESEQRLCVYVEQPCGRLPGPSGIQRRVRQQSQGLCRLTQIAPRTGEDDLQFVGVVTGEFGRFQPGAANAMGYDDSLDVVGVHLVGGIIGTLMVGLVAAPETFAGVAGLFYGGGWSQLGKQAIGAGAVLLYSAIGTAILGLIVKYTVGLRLDREDEASGIDESEHAESSYDFATAGTGSVLGRSEV